MAKSAGDVFLTIILIISPPDDPGGHAICHHAGGNIVRHDCTRAYESIWPNAYMINDGGADADPRPAADKDFSAQTHPWAYVSPVLDYAFMVDAHARVDDHILTNERPGIQDRSTHDDGPRAYTDITRNTGPWVDSSRQGEAFCTNQTG